MKKQRQKGSEKSMKLLIDANVIIDVLQDRRPHVADSAIVWKLCETLKAEGHISVLTFADLVYIMRKELYPSQIDDVLNKLSLIFRLTDLTANDLFKAAQLHWSDFEDALQSVTAERIHADYIITRNIRDFADSSVPAITPAEFCGLFK